MIETMDYHNVGHNLPPPPDPPSPPMPPPPRVPPLPPFPPAPPPDGRKGLRTWSPGGYNEAPEGTDDASDANFHIYCALSNAAHHELWCLPSLLRGRWFWRRVRRLPREHLRVAVAAGRLGDGA